MDNINKKSQGKYILDYFFSNKFFKIPEYQRRYKWNQKDNLEQFSSSMFSLIKGDIKNWFLGTITLKEDHDSVLVIDGQQRTTTFYLFLKALFDVNATLTEIYPEHKWDEDIDSAIKGYLFKNESVEGMKPKLKIKDIEKVESLNSLINSEYKVSDVLKKQKDFVTKGTNYYKNYFFFVTEIIKWITENNINIQDILESFKKIWIVTIYLDKDDDELSIFESINALGTPLTPTELLKNYIFIKLRSKSNVFVNMDHHRRITQLFEGDIAKAIGIENLKNEKQKDLHVNKLMRIYLIYKKIFISKDKNDGKLPMEKDPQNIYNNFKLIIEEKFNNIKTVKDFNDFVYDFTEFLTVYRKIKNYEKINSKSEFEISLSLLNSSFTGAQFFPVIKQAVDLTNWNFSHDRKEIWSDIPEEFKKVIKVLEAYIIKRNSVGQGSRTITRVIDQMRFDSLDDLYRTFTEGPTRVTSSMFIDALKNSNNIYKTMSAESLKTLLWKIELYKNNKTKETINLSAKSDFTIEHIMPQSILNNDVNEQWVRYLRSKTEGKEGIKVEYLLSDYEKKINVIGNLTLTRDNSELSNHLFDKKRELYEESQLKMNKELLKVEKWTEKEINQRTADICKIADEIWSDKKMKVFWDAK